MRRAMRILKTAWLLHWDVANGWPPQEPATRKSPAQVLFGQGIFRAVESNIANRRTCKQTQLTW